MASRSPQGSLASGYTSTKAQPERMPHGHDALPPAPPSLSPTAPRTHKSRNHSPLNVKPGPSQDLQGKAKVRASLKDLHGKRKVLHGKRKVLPGLPKVLLDWPQSLTLSSALF